MPVFNRLWAVVHFLPVANMSQAELNMKASFRERGYAVIARLNPGTVGEIVDAVNVGTEDEWPHPWYIISSTTREDFLEQCRLGGDPVEYISRAFRFFYRVQTD